MSRLILADDHKIFLQALQVLLQGNAEFKVVNICADGEEALDAIVEQAPDIAVLDISMPKLDGFEVVAAARARGSKTFFVMLSMFNEAAYVERSKSLGVSAYVLKESAIDELVNALHAVEQGKQYWSLDIDSVSSDRGSQPPQLDGLTPAELKVFWALSKNSTSRELAQILGISYRTVQNHRANICVKLGLCGANRLLEFAIAQRAFRPQRASAAAM